MIVTLSRSQFYLIPPRRSRLLAACEKFYIGCAVAGILATAVMFALGG